MTQSVDMNSLRPAPLALSRIAPIIEERRASLGIAALDHALFEGGLHLGGIHTVRGERSAALPFALTLLGATLRPHSTTRPVLWCVTCEDDLPTPAQLNRFGLAPDRLIVSIAENQEALVRILEEGLSCPGLAAVVGVVGRLSRTEAGRLEAARRGFGATGLHDAFNPHHAQPPLRRRPGLLWRGVAPSAEREIYIWQGISDADFLHHGLSDNANADAAPLWTVRDAPARGGWPTWLVTLECGRNLHSDWFLEWDEDAGGLALSRDESTPSRGWDQS
ncbi:MAG: hypothetical protein A2516_11720 [Alphaproteobacteria bacterium RIFOXYD12_FULL_60_8]|nr:MAG: hypothetical protein A2516_11720 [Alphaproteobacteria bacterium RIFOXYD12_FULL_60_8]